MEAAAMLWRRLDAAGQDACRLVHEEDAWRLDGVAAFQHSTVAAALAYTIDCDDGWRAR